VGKKAAASVVVETAADGTTSEEDPGSEQGGIVEVDSEADPSSSEGEESESGSDKKGGTRKPSKRALENAANEVSAAAVSNVSKLRGSPSNSDPFFLPTISRPTTCQRGRMPNLGRPPWSR